MARSAKTKQCLRPVSAAAIATLVLQVVSFGLQGTALAKSAPGPDIINGEARAILQPITAEYLKLYALEQADAKETPLSSADNALSRFNESFSNLKAPGSLGSTTAAYNKAIQLYKRAGINQPRALADWKGNNEAIWGGIANWGLDESSILTEEEAYGKPNASDTATLANETQLNQKCITAVQNDLAALSRVLVLKVSGIQADGSNKFKISITDTPGTTLNLFVNDKRATRTTVNVNDEGTFNNVSLYDTGKLSFTRVIHTRAKTSKPAGSTTYFSVAGSVASTSTHAFAKVLKTTPAPIQKPTATPVAAQATPQPVPVAPAATPQGCTPLSDEGTCYELGEYCRNSDHGASGIDGDGNSMTCEDNNGWRWEPN
jgi:hypothetical protein